MSHILAYLAPGFILVLIGYLAYRDDKKGASKDPAKRNQPPDGVTGGTQEN